MSIGSIGGISTTHINRTQSSLALLLEQISTGQRITSAAVDPAGLAVFNQLDTTSSSTRQAVRNANDGISVVQTAESATSSVQDNLQRMRELAMQASSGTLNDSQRADLNAEFSELAEGIDAISNSTEFNGVPLTDGSLASIDVQVGDGATSADNQISMNLTDLGSGNLGLAGVSIDSQGGAQTALDAIDSAISSVSSQRSELGSTQNRLESSITFSEEYAQNVESAAGRVMNLDFALATSQLAQNSSLQDAAVAAMVQANNLSRSSVGSLLGM